MNKSPSDCVYDCRTGKYSTCESDTKKKQKQKKPQQDKTKQTNKD